MSFVWFMQDGSNLVRDLYVVVCKVRKPCLQTFVVGVIIPCCFFVWYLFVFLVTVHREVKSLFVLKYQVMGDYLKSVAEVIFALLASFASFCSILSTNGLALWCIWLYTWIIGCLDAVSVQLCCCTDGCGRYGYRHLDPFFPATALLTLPPASADLGPFLFGFFVIKRMCSSSIPTCSATAIKCLQTLSYLKLWQRHLTKSVLTVHSTLWYLASLNATSKVLVALWASSVAFCCISADRFNSDKAPSMTAVIISCGLMFLSLRTLAASKESSWNSPFELEQVLVSSVFLTDTCLPFNISSTDVAFTFFTYSFLCFSFQSNQVSTGTRRWAATFASWYFSLSLHRANLSSSCLPWCISSKTCTVNSSFETSLFCFLHVVHCLRGIGVWPDWLSVCIIWQTSFSAILERYLLSDEIMLAI